MNKVFKVIWSEVRNAYVVVSEMAKSHGTKSCSTKKLLAMLIATGVMTCASVAPAMAANLAPEDTKIEVGNGASASGQGSVAIGNNAQASGLVGIAIGRDAVASGTDSIAIGGKTKANQIYSVAIGNDISYIGYSSTAVGQQAYATGDVSTAIGTMTNVDADYNATHDDWRKAGYQSTAIGAYSGSWGIASTALGGYSRADEKFATAVGYGSHATAERATTLGAKAEANAYESVAIGAFSVADRESGVVGAFAPEGADSLTWRANGGAVSVGSATLTRQITNVAAGTEATDAVNVAQLQEATQNTAWHLLAEEEITKDVNSTTKINHGDIVHFRGTDDNITISKEETEDATVMHVALSRNLVIDSVQAGDFFMNNEKGIGFGGNAYITKDGLNANDKVITNVAEGFYNTDAVNVGQLKEVEEVAANANKGWNLSTNGVATSAINVAPGEYVDFSGDKNISVSNDGTKVKAELNKDLVDIESISNGDAKLALNGAAGTAGMINGKGASIYMQDGYTVINSKVAFDQNGKISGVAAGVADTDAVNVGQLKEAVEAGNTDTHIKPGEYGVGADNTVNMDVVDKNGNKVDTVTIKDVAKASDVGNVNNIADDIKNGEGHTTVVDAVNNLNNKVGDLQYSKVEKGDIADGDSTTTAIGKLDQKLTDVAATAAKHTKVEGSSNITVTNTAKEGEAANYKVELNKDIDVETVKANSVTTGQTVMNNDGLKVGKDVSVTATAVKVGDTTITDKGLEIKDGPSVTKDGINAGNKKVTGVADGDVKENSKDAINGGQLHQVKADINNRIDGVENQVVNNTNRINQLGSRVNKVGAGAAALAALHPMDFDPDDKLTFSAGYGNYAGENAAAIGAYYRPDEKVMFSVAGTVGNGENMVNAGVSFALDRTNHVSNSRTALAREVIDLRGQLAVMGAKMAKMEKAFGMLDETKTKLFPDVPANHWAYEYIAKLAGNGYIEGYPDGNFGGDRLMTRYEFAAMLYRAIENGAALEEKIIKEFEPELGRIRVDRISGEDGDRDKIERVRVNDTKGERDHYGNKLAK